MPRLPVHGKGLRNTSETAWTRGRVAVLCATMPEMRESSSDDRLAAVRAYASAAMGCPAEAITAVARFEDGNRQVPPSGGSSGGSVAQNSILPARPTRQCRANRVTTSSTSSAALTVWRTSANRGADRRFLSADPHAGMLRGFARAQVRLGLHIRTTSGNVRQVAVSSAVRLDPLFSNTLDRDG